MKISIYAALLAALVILAGCGGGGGGGDTPAPAPAPTPVNVTVTCPNGTTQTAATLALANAACPSPQLLSISPTSGDTAVSADTFTQVTVSTDSTLDATSLTGTNVQVKIGATVVAGTVAATDAKGFKWTPSAKLAYSQAYSVQVAGVKDTLGKSLTFNATFTTQPAGALHYAATIVGVRYGRPGIITLTGPIWQEATNNTSYQFGAIPVFNAMISEAPLPDGTFLELVQAAVDGDFHVVAHNVVTNVITDYTGVVPAGYEVTRTGPSSWIFGAKWHGFTWGVPPVAGFNAWADAGGGQYVYTDNFNSQILRYTGVPSVLYTSGDGGAFTVLITISN